MINYPLMFTFRDAVSGNGFLADITMSGRALMMREDEKWWMYGVCPAAIAESGETPQETYLRFRNTYKNALFDFAEQASDYKSFRDAVEKFYHSPDDEQDRNWNTAVNLLRSGQVTPEDYFSELPKEPAASRPVRIVIKRVDGATVDKLTASDNLSDTYSLAAAA